MTLAEEILSKRELMVFIGVENHSTPYTPCLFNKIWEIPGGLPLKDLLIVPVQGLTESYMLSKDRITCFGRSLWVLFVKSSVLIHKALLFESFPQTDDNSYFTNENIEFLIMGNCRNVTVCDLGVYKSRSLVNLLNTAVSSLETYNISICLATILGYNSRGYTDIEIGDERQIYTKEFYLQTDIEKNVHSDNFHFIQVDEKFGLSKLYEISCFTQSPAESILRKIKQESIHYENSLKPLLDSGALKLILMSYNKGDSFDFKSFDDNLSKMGFNGEFVDSEWQSIYENLCSKIRNADQNQRGIYVQTLIQEINNNINLTLNFIKAI